MESEPTILEFKKEIEQLKEENKLLKDLLQQRKSSNGEFDSEDQDLTKKMAANFSTFFNEIKDFLFVLDDHGNIVEANQTVYDCLGYTKEELHGQSVLILHPAERREEAEQIMMAMLQGTAESCPIPLMTKSGKYIPVETKVGKGTWNARPAIFGVSKDISEIRLSEEKFSKAFHSSLTMSAMSDSKTGVYIDVNETFCNSLGYTKNELIGKSSDELNIIPLELRNKVLAENDLSKGLRNIEIKMRRKSGQELSALFSAELIYVQDKQYLYSTALDITESKKVQAELQKSDRKFRSVFDAIGVGIALTDSEGKILECNSAYVKVQGGNKEELVGRIFGGNLKIVRPDLSPMPQEEFASIRALKENHEVSDIEEGIYQPDGSIIWLNVSAEPVNLHGFGAIISYIDITARIEAENALKEKEELYRTVTENITDVIWIRNLTQDKFTYFSPSVYQLRGYTSEEAMALPIQEGMSPESVALISSQANKNMQQFLKNPDKREHKHFEIQHRCKDGHYIWVEDITQYQFAKNGDVEVLGVTRNIDKRKQAELALQKSEARLKLSIDTANEGTWDWNIRTGEMQWNSKWAEILGYKLDELEKDVNTWRNHVHPEDFKKVNEALQKHLNGEVDIYKAEYRLRTKSGEWKWVDDIGQVIEWDENKKPTRVIGLFYDLTQQKNIQQQLIELNATKDKFFSIIAHDLKNPFGAILGFSDLIEGECNRGEYDSIQEYNSYVIQAAKSGYTLLVNLLDWSRLQNGKICFNPENFNLFETVKDLAMWFNASLTDKNIEFQTFVSPEFMIKADRLMLETILRNLISNAIKFTPDGGHISVNASKQDSQTEITVSDTGVGIPSDKVAKLFKIEESFSTKGTKDETGTGLGLILCKDFVKQHHGTISVVSEPNKGTTFIISLPGEFGSKKY